MQSTRAQLKVSLFLLVLLLSISTLLAAGLGWYSLPEGGGDSLAQTRYAFVALAVLSIVLALLTWVILSRKVWRPLKQIGQYFDRISVGDLTQRVEAASQSEIGALYAAAKRLQENLSRNVGAVRAGLERISVGTRDIVVGNTDLSSRTEQQAAALQQTAASMEQLASTVKQNADNARQANQLAATASEVALRGGSAVGEVVSTMEGISASSRKISDIVGVIDSIAFQTNILALNAAVEAARAGEQGKGFAVVAAEVRALAQRSANAAKEIKGLIDDSVKKVAEGSQQVEHAGATMQEIVSSVARVTDIMGEITAATTEQSSGIEQINLAVTQMDGVTQQNAALVEHAARSASELQEQVGQVSTAISVYKLSSGNKVIDVTPKTPAPAAAAGRAAPLGRSALAGAPGSAALPRPAATPALDKPASAARLTGGATARDATNNDGDWEEF
ncbi:Methyl-accepting chemotaxis protein OS=Eoetvoesiella caeni OX=645616 GN=DFR37_101422 PE=3 SV=1 [Eoetvoesiella caeni]|uniref:Methyl-accepting chemotaxis protein n=1 Tax=Eoetvoesiella caeni TaxID=645616 RepID=A0A366HK44_9BURK|nr:methyl-accepting chemotaxis protein [Eoetvoesiella caeni]MCI2807294.1 methyl-accepting chemotaxis protein [Eoetvoesiella caeni]NYT53311.1 HAMP domain-containing protein [Eoetvoesiella caeni]RBP43293.1 methyl-accepting chemotaxis protein [Eoetvoesiella caeni]